MPLHPPLTAIASWPRPNYVNPEMHGSARIACAVAMSPLILLVVTLRFYTRVRLTKNLGLDGWIIGFAVVSPLMLPSPRNPKFSNMSCPASYHCFQLGQSDRRRKLWGLTTLVGYQPGS